MDLIQTIPLANDTEYCIDVALDLDEIDAGTHLICKLYGPRDVINEICGGAANNLGVSRRDICRNLTVVADRIAPLLSPERRAALTLASLMHMRGHVQRTAWFYAVCSYEDMLTGGNLVDYKRPGNIQEERRMWSFDLSPKQRRRLYGPNWIRRTVKIGFPEEARVLRTQFDRIRARCWPIDMRAAKAESDALMDDLAAQRRAHRAEDARRLQAYLRVEEAARTPVRITSTGKRFRKHKRGIIKKAAHTAVSVLGPKAVSDFARGAPVLIEGTAIDISVERLGSSARRGHGGVMVRAHAKTEGSPRLADLCIYYEDTPALDQLTALGLSMQAGEEAEIIDVANLSNITSEGFEHPLIAARTEQVATVIAREVADRVPGVLADIDQKIVAAARRTARNHATRDQQRAIKEAYWTATRSLWIEATGIHAMGRAWVALDKALGPLPAGSGHTDD